MNVTYHFDSERIASWSKPAVAQILSTGSAVLQVETKDGQVNIHTASVIEARKLLAALSRALELADAYPMTRCGVDL